MNHQATQLNSVQLATQRATRETRACLPRHDRRPQSDIVLWQLIKKRAGNTVTWSTGSYTIRRDLSNYLYAP